MRNWEVKLWAILMAIFAVLLIWMWSKPEPTIGMAENLKLKVSKDRILFSEDIDDIQCKSEHENCINKGKIKRYRYISGRKLTRLTI